MMTATSVTSTHTHTHMNSCILKLDKETWHNTELIPPVSCHVQLVSLSLGYSVAVGEFTGDSEQGEKANNSLQLTTCSTRGIPRQRQAATLQRRLKPSMLVVSASHSWILGEHCGPCDGLSDRERTAGGQCLGLNSGPVMRTVSGRLGRDPEGTGLQEPLIKGFPVLHTTD